MPEQSTRDLIIEAATTQILDLAQNGRMVLDKHGEPILDEQGNPKRRQLSAADINAISKYLKETRPQKNGPDDVPSELVNRLNEISDAKRPVPAVNTEEDDEATRGG